ncbi:MAG: multiheme c-type cytochrome, partial [Thermoguttaceae bacterium]
MRRHLRTPTRTWLSVAWAIGFVSLWAGRVDGQAFGLPAMSEQTKACIACHKEENAPIYQQWGNSKHYRANVGCYECHAADQGEPDAFNHEGAWIATIVSPKDCSKCHVQEATEFAHSHHSKAARILGSLDNTLAEVIEGNRGLVTPAFAGGNSA